MGKHLDKPFKVGLFTWLVCDDKALETISYQEPTLCEALRHLEGCMAPMKVTVQGYYALTSVGAPVAEPSGTDSEASCVQDPCLGQF